LHCTTARLAWQPRCLFRMPGEKLCQLRSWTLTETYRGSSRYQRAAGVQIGYVRWQSCK